MIYASQDAAKIQTVNYVQSSEGTAARFRVCVKP
jgi:hypothetical protein